MRATSPVIAILDGELLAWKDGVVLPFLVFNYFIAFFIFLHHTHPDVPFFDQRPEWSNTIGQVYCSIVVRCWSTETRWVAVRL